MLLAREFNPSILAEHWLVKHGIIPEDPRERQIIAVPGFTRIETAHFTIEARADRAQLTIGQPEQDTAQDIVTDKVGKIVGLLPETPYAAVGLNFHWAVVSPDRERVAAGLRTMFVKDDSAIYALFGSDDARFGGYLSKESMGFRLRLDIKPISAEHEVGGRATPAEGVLYQFNYHRDLQPDVAIGQVREALSRWADARDESDGIFHSTMGWMADGSREDAAAT